MRTAGSGIHLLGFGLIALASAAWAQPSFRAQDAYRIYSGRQPSSWFGSHCYTVGDVDADGVPDLAVAARLEDGAAGEDAGRVYVFSGRTDRTIWIFEGETPGAELGHRMDRIGDVDGDGHADLLLGAYDHDDSRGRVYVYSGRTGGLLHAWEGREAGDRFGWSVENAGDTDGDGVDDVLIGILGSDLGGQSSGEVHLYSGATGERRFQWVGEGAGDHLGFRTEAAGDVDGDGLADVILSAPDHDANGRDDVGKVTVRSGATGDVIYEFVGERAIDRLGDRIASAGDVNADGYDDILIASINHSRGTGRVYLFSGFDGRPLLIVDGESQGDNFGQRLSAAGDVDGDGYADFIISAYSSDSNGVDSGSVYVYSGRDLSPIYEWTGENQHDRFGRSIMGGLDFNGDGYDDVAVGAPKSKSMGPYSGRVYVYSGRTGSLLYRINGEGAGDQFGYAINTAGDLDGDGLPDLTVGSVHNDGAGHDAGRVYVFKSTRLTLGSGPLEAGSRARVFVTGADPFEEVHFAGSRTGIGHGPRLGAFGDLRLDLKSPVHYLGSAEADALGNVSVRIRLPGDVPQRLFFQAAVRRGPNGVDSIKSNPYGSKVSQ